MVELSRVFNPAEVDPQDNNFDPLPSGWYPAIIDETAQKSTKAAERGENDDWYVNLRYSIVGERYANRKVFQMLNLQNQSQQAMEIAYRQLSSICHAIGSGPIKNTDQLKNMPMSIHLKMVPAINDDQGNEKYAAKNEVNGWQSLDDATAAPDTPAAINPTDVPEVKAAVPDKPPWEK